MKEKQENWEKIRLERVEPEKQKEREAGKSRKKLDIRKVEPEKRQEKEPGKIMRN